jgi:F plasmid transfer operon protein TraF
MGRTFRLVVCALAVCPTVAFAQRFDDFGVRAQGMGGAFVAVADDASATWWNPAGLAHALTVVDLSGSILKDGRRSVALGFPSLGLSYYRLKIRQIQPAIPTTGTSASGRQDIGAAGNDPSLRESGLSEFGASVGQSLSQHLVIATTLKLENALDDTKPDLDVGVMGAFGPMRVGLTVKNVRQPTFGDDADAYELTRRARVGAALVHDAVGTIDRIVVAVDADLTSAPVAGRDEREVAGGAEVWLKGRRIGVRGGGGINTVTGASGRSFGAVGLTVVPYPRLNVEAAVTRGADSMRDQWSVGLRLTF